MTTEQINKAAEEYASTEYPLSITGVLLYQYAISDFTAGANYALSHSRQEIAKLSLKYSMATKAMSIMREQRNEAIDKVDLLEAENEKLRDNLELIKNRDSNKHEARF
jgi:hypothetical protein